MYKKTTEFNFFRERQKKPREKILQFFPLEKIKILSCFEEKSFFLKKKICKQHTEPWSRNRYTKPICFLREISPKLTVII